MNGSQSPLDDDATIEAYVLGTLSPEEAADFEARLATTPELRQRVEEAKVVPWLLAGSVPQISPSADLRARILAAAAAEGAASTPAPPPQPITALPGRRPGRSPRLAPWKRWLTAAALLLALGLGTWNVQQQQQLARQGALIARQQAELAQQEAALQTLGGAERFWTMRGVPERAPAATSTLALNSAAKQTVLIVRGFPPPPPGETYQVWVILNGQPVSVGSFTPSGPESEHTLVIPSDLTGVTQAAITIEPAPGSLGPTGPVVMGGNL